MASSTALELFWDRVPDATLYQVMRNGQLLAVTNGKSLWVDQLTPGTEYTFQVLLNEQPIAADLTVTTLSDVAIETPPLAAAEPVLTGAVYSRTAVEIFWERIDGNQSYRVFRNNQAVFDTDGNSMWMDDLDPGTTYHFRLEVNGQSYGNELVLTTRTL